MKDVNFSIIIIAIVVLLIYYWALIKLGLFVYTVILVPTFGLPELNFWQFFGLYVLARMFFGNGSNIVRVKGADE